MDTKCCPRCVLHRIQLSAYGGVDTTVLDILSLALSLEKVVTLYRCTWH